MLFNPFTGLPRRPDDVESDPRGFLIWDGKEPLRASHEVQNCPMATNPLTNAMYLLHPGDRTWVESTLDGYKSLLSRVTLKSRYHRCIKGRTFSGSVYIAVRGTETVVLICVTRLT